MQKEIVDEIYLRIEAERHYNWRNVTDEENIEYQRKELTNIMPDIKRHVDGVSCMTIDCDTHWECEFCGSDNHQNKTEYECCDEALDEHEAVDAQ